MKKHKKNQKHTGGYKMKQKKPGIGWFFIGTVLTCFVVMVLVVTTSLFIYHKLTTGEDDDVEAMAYIENQETATSSEEETDTQMQIENILENSETAAKDLGKVEFLSQFKQGLESGTDILTLLRSFYPNEIVVASGGTYKFHTINRNLKMHELQAENIKVLDNGEMQYTKDGTIISHKGIDVSKFQGVIDWNAVKQDGVEYAFIRVGLRGYETGEIVEDECFKTNIEGANAAGVSAGVYFFSQAVTEAEAVEEAEFVLNLIKDYKIDCPIVYDVEKVANSTARMNQINQEERTAITIAFCERIKEAGYEPMIYANMEMFTQLVDISQLEAYEKWYAYYDPSLYYPYDFTVWQYSEKGAVAGITGDVDMNISFKKWSEGQ